MKQDNEKFRQEMRQEFKDFKDEVNTRFERLETQVAALQNDVTGLKHDVAGLYHWDYWLLSIILVVFAMPQIISGIKSLFSVVIEGLSGIIKVFRKD